MTRLRRSWPAAAACLFVLAGCAGTSTTGTGVGTEPSAEAVSGAAPILRITQVGGLVSAATHVTRLPGISVYRDGRVITEGPVLAIYPAAALPNVLVQRLQPAAAKALVDKAVAAGVNNGVDLGRPPVADMPATRFTAVTDGGTQTVEVLALREVSAGSGLTDAQRAGRAKLIAFDDTVRKLAVDFDKPAEPYVPVAMAVVARPFVARDEAGLSRAPAVPWPGPALPGEPLGKAAELRCAAVSGAELAAVLSAARTAKENTAWTSGGKQWSVTFRPLLPEETGCADLGRVG